MDTRLFAECLCKALNEIFKIWFREFLVVSLTENICAADRITDRASAASEFISKHLRIGNGIINGPLEQIVKLVRVSYSVSEDHLNRSDQRSVCKWSCNRHRDTHFRERSLKIDTSL